MKSSICTMLVIGVTALAGAAHAQVPPTPFTASQQERGDSGWNADLERQDFGVASFKAGMHPGIAALEANDFAQAEELLGKSLQYNKNNISLRLHMGIAKMELGKWDEARHYLRTPAREMRRDPEPKSLLGVTYVKLGDFESAFAQRESLLQMAAACQTSCARAAEIESGIALIDAALAEAGVKS